MVNILMNIVTGGTDATEPYANANAHAAGKVRRHVPTAAAPGPAMAMNAMKPAEPDERDKRDWSAAGAQASGETRETPVPEVPFPTEENR